MNYVYHLGVHKTGSTLLQHNLLKNLPALRAQGVYYVNGEFDLAIRRKREALRKLQNNNRVNPPADRFATLAARIRRMAEAAGAHTILLSEENFIGKPTHHQLAWHGRAAQFYPRATDCLKLITCAVDPADMKCILYTRDQKSVLRGHYVEGLRALQVSDSLEDFLNKVELDTFRFDRLVGRLQAAFPGATFETKAFETIKNGADRFVRDFAKSCGIDSSLLQIDTSVVNGTLDADQAALLRELSARRLNGEKIRPLRKAAHAIESRPADKSKPIKMPRALAEKIDRVAAGDRLRQLA